MIKIKCAVCGKEIINPTLQQKTCSKECSKEYHKAYQKAYMKAYHKTDKYKAYQKTDKCKAYHKAYYQKKKRLKNEK